MEIEEIKDFIDKKLEKGGDPFGGSCAERIGIIESELKELKQIKDSEGVEKAHETHMVDYGLDKKHSYFIFVSNNFTLNGAWTSIRRLVTDKLEDSEHGRTIRRS